MVIQVNLFYIKWDITLQIPLEFHMIKTLWQKNIVVDIVDRKKKYLLTVKNYYKIYFYFIIF